jgi:hypothetical protein
MYAPRYLREILFIQTGGFSRKEQILLMTNLKVYVICLNTSHFRVDEVEIVIPLLKTIPYHRDVDISNIPRTSRIHPVSKHLDTYLSTFINFQIWKYLCRYFRISIVLSFVIDWYFNQNVVSISKLVHFQNRKPLELVDVMDFELI